MIRLEFSPRGVAGVVAALAGLWLLITLWPVVLLALVSLMFAAAVLPFVEWLVRHGASRGVAVLIVMALLIAVLVAIGLLVVPAVVTEARALIDRLPELREHTVAFLNKRGATDLARQVEEYDPSTFFGPGRLVTTGKQVLSAVTTIVSLVVLTTYIMLDARRIERFVYFSTPVRWHEHIRSLLRALQTVVGGYLRGQLLTSGAITLFTFVALTALGVPNALALGVLAGIADMIPVIGVFLCVGPATLAALSKSLPTAAIVAALLIAYEEFENRYLVQKIYGTTLRLPAVAVLLALLAGGQLLGVAGALLSLPAAAALRVVIEYANDVRRGVIPAAGTGETPFAPDTDGRFPVRAG
jgi:predicted PurR-regulated permease PerM